MASRQRTFRPDQGPSGSRRAGAVALEQRQRNADHIRASISDGAYRTLPGSPIGEHRTTNEVRDRALANLESRDNPQKNTKVIEAAVKYVEQDLSGRMAERAAVSGDPRYTRAFLK